MRARPLPVADHHADPFGPAERAAPIGYSGGNLLLDALPPLELAGLARNLEVVVLEAHRFTHSAGGAMSYVDFPIDAVLSVAVTLEDGDSIETGTVGRESFVEADAALDSPVSWRTSFCQVEGRVGRMSVERFQERMSASGPFAALMRRNVRATLFSTQQLIACSVRHSVLQRCARWLAMTADRASRPRFSLTHDFLSIMLGVRRAGVSEAADALHRLGAIEYKRGVVTVLDAKLLEDAACECYAVCKKAFAASLPS